MFQPEYACNWLKFSNHVGVCQVSTLHYALLIDGTPAAIHNDRQQLSSVTSEHPDTLWNQQLSLHFQMPEGEETSREEAKKRGQRQA